MAGEFLFPKGSVCLNALAKVWPHVRRGARWALGNMWLTGREPLINVATGRIPAEQIHAPVAEFVTTAGEWWWAKFEDLLPATTLLLVAAVLPPKPSTRVDRLVWGYTSNSNFPTKTAYEALTRVITENTRPLWRAIWRAPAAQRVRQFLWLACRDRLFTNMERVHRHMAGDVACYFFGQPESTSHVLRDCANASSIWTVVIPTAIRWEFFAQELREWIGSNLMGYGQEVPAEWATMFSITCWRIWHWRNRAIFSNEFLSLGAKV
ncbi:FMN reductase (NADH) RutF [Striga asiatica]|uniref:FMN reductase (NADH) RutF n=1 Tax=Striga asiatica TaxID=4170 RepID=A0A5A7PXD5_STRAF|nr:FMN reductase (NADH) RutF [Striga asiatica]